MVTNSQNMLRRSPTLNFKLLTLNFLILLSLTALGQPKHDPSQEKRYYQINDVTLPDSILLEVGGMAFIESGKLAVCTRRGEIWIINNLGASKKPGFTKFASGLHEPLGLAWHKGSIYVNQRSELTRITDTDQDGKADLFEAVQSWPLSGNYHEYSYGPLVMPNGDMLVTLNLSWVGRGESLAKWRGWMMKITKDGKLIPYAAGMRSPAGFGFNDAGDLFFAENQGDWISSGKITHIEPGDFATHPASLRWSREEGSSLKHLTRDQFPDSIGSLHDFGKNIKNFKEPSVIFPHTLMGISTSDIVTIPEGFGPFKGQLLVGDQGHSKIMRAFVEKVNGKYQGACFPFLEGFSSGVLRLAWTNDHTLFVGMTSRGWSATGPALYGLQYVTWKKTVPFEISTVRAKPYGFELAFTKPVNKKLAEDIARYGVTGFTYVYHKKYGSPIVDQKNCTVTRVEVSADGLTVNLYIQGLREGYVHQLDVSAIRSQAGEAVLHPVAYYTLNAIPEGAHEAQANHAAHQAAANETASGCGEVKTKNVTEQPTTWQKGADIEITIGTKPGLKFDKDSFEVPEGSRVKLIFNNNDDMLHNLLITKKGKGKAVGEMALHLGLDGSRLGYVPTTDDVLFNTCLVQPESAQAIYFIAPPVGVYPYICSYPGHYLVMTGVMKIVPKRISLNQPEERNRTLKQK